MVASGIVREDAAAMAKALVPRCPVSAPARWPGGRRSGGSAHARAMRPALRRISCQARRSSWPTPARAHSASSTTSPPRPLRPRSSRSLPRARSGPPTTRGRATPHDDLPRRLGARSETVVQRGDSAPAATAHRCDVRHVELCAATRAARRQCFGAGRLGYATRPPTREPWIAPWDDRADGRLTSKGYVQCSYRRSQSRASCQPASRSAS